MNFSLDKVAQQAGVSKGGLVHHFATKEELLRAAAVDTIERFESKLTSKIDQDDGDSAGKMTRAYIDVVLDTENPTHVTEASPLVISYLNEKDSVDEPNRFESWQARTEEDGIDTITATIVRLAVDGILYTELIDSKPIPQELRRQIYRRLHEMLDSSTGVSD